MRLLSTVNRYFYVRQLQDNNYRKKDRLLEKLESSINRSLKEVTVGDLQILHRLTESGVALYFASDETVYNLYQKNFELEEDNVTVLKKYMLFLNDLER